MQAQASKKAVTDISGSFAGSFHMSEQRNAASGAGEVLNYGANVEKKNLNSSHDFKSGTLLSSPSLDVQQ